ncbi:MAG: DUF5103 domain-containing protein [Chitinophagaceae bacterium]|nr:DUF5103 domain-containing protein [Chitinophagaceae bacterium]
MKFLFTSLLALVTVFIHAQQPDQVYKDNIRSVRLYKAGDIYSYPILTLNSNEQLELHFDDMDADIKNYYFSFQLCNADWTVSNLLPFDYVRGFQSTRITNYRNSSISINRYTHYQASFPDRNGTPTRSGNYLLKVFRNNDTSDLYFTRRFLVIENKVSVGAQVRQPFDSRLFQSDQRVHVILNTANARINILSPQDIKLVVLQNYSWQNAARVDKPTIFRGNYFEYNDDATTFQAGREWRWIDLRSLRLMSDRMARMADSARQVHVYVKPDAERRSQVYIYYRDLNGLYTIENTDGNNPYWQSDYAWTHFTFVPPNNQAYPGKDIYLYGDLTNYRPDENSKMTFNADKGVYEKAMFLKQGYYNYSYVTQDYRADPNNRFSFSNTEGNFNATENAYMVLIYYRPFGARADELIGYAQVNSLALR